LLVPASGPIWNKPADLSSAESFRDRQMAQPISAPETIADATRPSRAAAAIVAIAAAAAALLVVGAVGLWAHYGTTVFFEMIKTGIAACI
jgi:uncharacterized membrane protein (DUF2068 family)